MTASSDRTHPEDSLLSPFGIWRCIPISGVLCVLAACSGPAPVDRPNLLPEEKQVLGYMRSRHPSEKERERIVAVLNQCQTVSVLFHKGTPSDPHDKWLYELDLKWHMQGYSEMKGTQPVSHKFAVAWTAMDGQRSGRSASEWVSDLSGFAKRGYETVDAMVIESPDEATVANTLKLFDLAMGAIKIGLENRKADHPQLVDLEKARIGITRAPKDYRKRAREVGEGWCGGLDYRYGCTYTSDRQFKKDTDAWCSISVGIEAEMFRDNQWTSRRITYRKQGMSISWSVRSEDDAFNKDVDSLIRSSCSGVDAYERELGSEPIETLPSKLWCYN